jgi:putative PIN family toxin of toxin-antitoxin system
MPEPVRFVADTSVTVSRLFFRNSVPALAFEHALLHARMIVSTETLVELEDVLSRSKFDTYLPLQKRMSFFHYLRRNSDFVESVAPITACRDPKDDKFLALALAGHANLILSGDQDLLILHPFRGIKILTPRQYLDQPSG